MSTRTAARVVLASLGLSLALLAGSAWAQEPSAEEEAQGKQLAVAGFDAYKKGEFEEALAKFDEAAKIYPTGQVLRMKGYSLLALKRWQGAAEALEESITAQYKPLDDALRPEVQGELDKALQHLGTVGVTSSVAGATVRVDGGAPKPLPIDVRLTEGTHSFVVTAEGYTNAERSVDVIVGQRVELPLDPAKLEAPKPPEPPKPPPPPPEPESTSWFPYQREVGLGVGVGGVALLAAGIGTLASGVSLGSAVKENIDSHNSTYGESCTQGSYDACYLDVQLINADGDRATTLQTTGIVLTISGAAVTALGAVFFFMAPWQGDAEKEATPAPDAAPEGAQARAFVGCGPFAMGGVACAGTF